MNLLTTAPTKAALAAALTVALCGPMLAAGPANATTSTDTNTTAVSTAGLESADRTADVEGALRLIESVPDDVLLEGQVAYERWAAENRPALYRTARASILECTGAIALLIATTAFPVAKILKIKRLISSLGGVAKAVRILWGASFSWEKIRALGGAAAALGAELLGIAAVKRGCFR